MSFIRGNGVLIYRDDVIAKSKKINAAPFNLIYRTPQHGEPKINSREDVDNPVLINTSMLKKIADTKRMVTRTNTGAEFDYIGDDSALFVAS